MPSGLRWGFKNREYLWQTDRLTRPLIMGILNVTPDSFSDGGRFASIDEAISEGQRLAAAGADIIDVGGESTRPGAKTVSAPVERERVIPVIRALARRLEQPISIDTTKAVVARAAIDAGAELINDISAGLFDPDMLAVAAQSEAGLVLMHTRGTPQVMQAGDLSHPDIVGAIAKHLSGRFEAAVQAGIEPDAICLDPGIGFGKTVGQNLALLGAMSTFLDLGRPVLVGASRKSFIGAVLNREVTDRDAGTHAISAYATWIGAHVVRVHDVEGTHDAIRMINAIRSSEGARP
ncbi:MAG: dihydropteroate synthase [Myxococcota bacterium]|nr:dihydropteroate synthase [Myxococcota bacterium]